MILILNELISKQILFGGKYMKTITYLLTAFLCLTSCTSKPKESKKENQSVLLTKEEQEQCIQTLSLYLEKDSVRIAESEEYAKFLEEELPETPGMENESNSMGNDDFYSNNIVHIDSIMLKGIELSKQNKPKELLLLLEKDLKNIHAHPGNLLENEIQLHSIISMLYSKFYAEKEAAIKSIALFEITRLHSLTLIALNAGVPYSYPTTLYGLSQLYKETGNYPVAIERGRELCNLMEQLHTEQKESKDYIYALMELTDIYKEAKMKAQQDSCNRILQASPTFKSIYEE